MTIFPTHDLANFDQAFQLPDSFALVSSDDISEQETLAGYFGGDLDAIKSRYAYLFVHTTEDLVVIYGVLGFVRLQAYIDLIYLVDTTALPFTVFNPHAGVAIEDNQQWGHSEYNVLEKTSIPTHGFIPFPDSVYAEDTFVGISDESEPRLVRTVYSRKFRGETNVYSTFYTRADLVHFVQWWEDSAYPDARRFLRQFSALLRLADQWGVK